MTSLSAVTSQSCSIYRGVLILWGLWITSGTFSTIFSSETSSGSTSSSSKPEFIKRTQRLPTKLIHKGEKIYIPINSVILKKTTNILINYLKNAGWSHRQLGIESIHGLISHQATFTKFLKHWKLWHTNHLIVPLVDWVIWMAKSQMP